MDVLHGHRSTDGGGRSGALSVHRDAVLQSAAATVRLRHVTTTTRLNVGDNCQTFYLSHDLAIKESLEF